MSRRRMMMMITEEVDYSTRYFTLKALQTGTFKHTSYPVDYSIDGGNTWTTLSAGSSTPTVQAGTKVMFRGNITPSSSYGVGTFTGTNSFAAEGNVMSLLYGDNFEGQVDLTGKNYAFYRLFYNSSYLQNAKNLSLSATTLANICYSGMFSGCTNLTTAPELPATTLAYNCYSGMFSGCTNLTTAPELPATTLANYCYDSMFYGCTNLTTAPELPATTLADYCYNNMFYGCTSLTTAPELPATTLANKCYSGMIGGTNLLPDTSNIDFTSKSVVASGGLQSLFYNTKVTYNDLCNILPMHNNKPCLPVLELANYCYSGMFSGCTNLTTAPELPATTLESGCYDSMFYGCTNLTTAPELPATTLANNCYNRMFYGCTSLTTVPSDLLPATTLAYNCYSEMFRSCTSLTTAPELPATTLANNCYNRMFYGCTSLNYIKAMFTTEPSSSYTRNWVSGVAATGTFVKNSAATWNVTGNNGIPNGWTVQTASS